MNGERHGHKLTSIFLTVGMGRWPFDRLVSALDPWCRDHDVFAQIGTSTVRPGCAHRDFIGADEFDTRLAAADIVITHAGNTVRLVQRQGRVPIAVAREQRFGEMGNDHQVHYLRHEEQFGRVIPVWDVDRLEATVSDHEPQQRRLLLERDLPAVATPEHVVTTMEEILRRIIR